MLVCDVCECARDSCIYKVGTIFILISFCHARRDEVLVREAAHVRTSGAAAHGALRDPSGPARLRDSG